MPCRFIKRDSDANQQALVIPGQSNASPDTASSRATDAASVSYTVAGNERTISFNGLAAQGTYQSAVDSVNNFFGTAPVPKASGSRGFCHYGDKCTKQGNGCKYQHPAPKQSPKQSAKSVPDQNGDVIEKLLVKNEQLRNELEEKNDTISSHERTIRDLFSEIETLRKQVQSGSTGSWADATDDQDDNQSTNQADDQAARIAAALG